MELPALAKVNNAHVKRKMYSAQQNVIKMFHVTKIKDINNIQLNSFLSSVSIHSIL